MAKVADRSRSPFSPHPSEPCWVGLGAVTGVFSGSFVLSGSIQFALARLGLSSRYLANPCAPPALSLLVKPSQSFEVQK